MGLKKLEPSWSEDEKKAKPKRGRTEKKDDSDDSPVRKTNKGISKEPENSEAEQGSSRRSRSSFKGNMSTRGQTSEDLKKKTKPKQTTGKEERSKRDGKSKEAQSTPKDKSVAKKSPPKSKEVDKAKPAKGKKEEVLKKRRSRKRKAKTIDTADQFNLLDII